jgi:hypothetical protein
VPRRRRRETTRPSARARRSSASEPDRCPRGGQLSDASPHEPRAWSGCWVAGVTLRRVVSHAHPRQPVDARGDRHHRARFVDVAAEARPKMTSYMLDAIGKRACRARRVTHRSATLRSERRKTPAPGRLPFSLTGVAVRSVRAGHIGTSGKGAMYRPHAGPGARAMGVACLPRRAISSAAAPFDRCTLLALRVWVVCGRPRRSAARSRVHLNR